MKNLLLATAIVLSSTEAFAVEACKGVDKEDTKAFVKALVKKLEHAVSEADIGNGPAAFDKEIKGKDKRCAIGLAIAKHKGQYLEKPENDVALLVDILRNL
jgi:hypothetical protein